MLILLSGVPGTGKSAVADELGRVLPAPVFSVDQFVPWPDEHLVIDSVRPVVDNVARVLRYIGRHNRS